MDEIAQFLSYGLLCPVALHYIFLFHDQWRISLGGKALFMVMSALLSWGLLLFPPVWKAPLGGFLVLPWAVLTPLLFWMSRQRGFRLLFIIHSAILFTCLTNSVADKVSYHTVVPTTAVYLLLNSGILLVCRRFFRPVFLTSLQTNRRGWGFLCLIPLILWWIYLNLLSYPDYQKLAALPQVEFFVVALLCMALLIYRVMFTLFQRLEHWQEEAVAAAVLDAQLAELDQRLRTQREASEAARMLRHDLRHYLPLFSQRLTAGDTQGARDILAAMAACNQAAYRNGGDEGG